MSMVFGWHFICLLNVWMCSFDHVLPIWHVLVKLMGSHYQGKPGTIFYRKCPVSGEWSVDRSHRLTIDSSICFSVHESHAHCTVGSYASLCLSVCPWLDQNNWTIIHILKGIVSYGLRSKVMWVKVNGHMVTWVGLWYRQMGSHQRHVAFLSPPVHIALWAHMHHFDQLWQNMLAPPDNLFIIE